MTKVEFNDLYDSLYYGHDAELLINGNRVFVEWNGEKIELFHVVDDVGNKLCELSDSTKLDTVKMLFKTSIFDKTLNNNYNEIVILDIE